MTSWNVTLFFVNLAAFVGFVSIYKSAPCWMQKLSVFGFGLGMLLVVIAYGLSLADIWWAWQVRQFGFSVEHIALLLWVCRILFFPKGAPTWTSFSALFHNS